MKSYCLTLLVLILCCGLTMNDAKSQNWEQEADFPGTGRDHPVAFGINDTGYFLVGKGVQNFNYQELKDFYRYIPATDEWEQLQDFPGDARGYSIGIAHQGKGYIGFGEGPNGFLDDLWEYDPKTDEWTELASCPCAKRQHPALEAANGKLYLGLGNSSGSNLNDWWVYDIDANSWAQLPDMPGPPRHHPYHFTIDGKIYAGMGHGQRIYDDWYEFDPEDSSWTQMSDHPGQAKVAGTQFAYGGKGYVLSGDGADHDYIDSGEFWMYEPDTDEWDTLPAHPGNSLWAPTNFIANDHLYFAGGYDRNAEAHPNALFSFPITQTTSKLALAKKLKTSFKVYPNPVQKTLKFSDNIEASKVQVLNANGQLVKTEKAVEDQIDVRSLSSGLYLIRVKGEKGQWHQTRFLKKQ